MSLPDHFRALRSSIDWHRPGLLFTRKQQRAGEEVGKTRPSRAWRKLVRSIHWKNFQNLRPRYWWKTAWLKLITIAGIEKALVQ
jgi:hypothetical protein